MYKIQFKVGNEEMSIETGRLAKQADGAVLLQYGGTVLLATVCSEQEPKEGQDFFPLLVDYREKTFAAGKIPGGFFKREGKQSEREVLTSRLIDRPIRPLFPEGYLNDVQISVTVLSVDQDNCPDVLSIVAASCALQVSSVPFMKPIAGVRVGYIDGRYVINPTFKELEQSSLDLVVAASEDSITMVEAGAKILSEDVMIKGIIAGHNAIKDMLKHTKDFGGEHKRPKQTIAEGKKASAEVVAKINKVLKGRISAIHLLKSRDERRVKSKELYDEVFALFDKESPDFNEAQIKAVCEQIEYDEVRDLIVNQKKRPDGRAFDEIRPITCEVGVLPRTHGSSVFTRGQTQSLGTITLGTSRDQQIIDALEGEYKKSFMLHYNFPPFSVGEIGPNRGPGRREIGHGALAERAIKTVLPTEEKFPYTIRMVSEILESNGSSSMASVCSATLALMDAGVPISAPVAGIAMGLVTKDSKWEVLTDIAGIEDHLGDMDFKVAGTREGVTALQLDIKITGVTEEILQTALKRAHVARMKILDIMQKTIVTPREDVSAYAPRITSIKISTEKIGALIGPGGKMIRQIIEDSGAEVDVDDDGTVHVASVGKEASEKAIQMIKAITDDIEVGTIFDATVVRLAKFGAFCELTPTHDGLLHVSEIKNGYVEKVEDVLKVGQVVKVIVKGVENGKISLSMKQLEAKQAPKA